MRTRLSLYVLPVLAIVACKEALPLVDGGDPEGDAQTPEQDASSVADSALVDSGSPDTSADVSAPQDGGGDALDASADAYVAPSEDGGIVTGDVILNGYANGAWSVPTDGGGLRTCPADASVISPGCCAILIPQLEGSALTKVTLDLTTGALTIGGRTMPTLQMTEKDAGYFEGRAFPSTFATVPVALDSLVTAGSPADRAEVSAFFGQPNYYSSLTTQLTHTSATWDRATGKLVVWSSHSPQWSNNGCRSGGSASVQSR